MNIGVFSGSFNPIHIGHLILANYLVEFTDLDEVWFVVSPQNPLKINVDLLDEEIRLKMVEIAIEDFVKFKACDFEFHLPRPSFTCRTLLALSERYPEHIFSLIIGADNWQLFDKWKDFQFILDNYNLYVYPRISCEIGLPDNATRVNVVSAPIIDISSTFLRNSISKGKDIKAFLPIKVYDYISQNKLYQV